MKTMELCIEVENISTETIKPSTTTPQRLESYQLSLIDQVSITGYTAPLVFFYNAPRCCCTSNNDEGISIFITRLKESLSKTLAIYYPLAGRVIPLDSIINCNDQGVPLVVARANCTLFSYLTASNRVDLVPRFIPKDEIFIDMGRVEVDGLILAVFQISVFKCGGFALGSHAISKAIDGTTWTKFFVTWAAIATGCSPQLSELDLDLDPDLTTQTRIFPPVSKKYLPPPPRRESKRYVSPPPGVPAVLQPVQDGSGGSVVKAFVFSPENISGLQDRARSESVSNPTRLESVTAFLWKHLMAAAANAARSSITSQESVPKITAAIHSVNVRPHLRPPLPPTSFGKYVTHAIANSKTAESGGTVTLSELVVSLRHAFSKSKDIEWLNKFRGEGRVEAILQHKKTLEEFFLKSYFFNSLRGLDQINFGSGEPVWIGVTGGKVSSYFMGFFPLIYTSGRRIEAWVILDEMEMKVLESDREFLAFATPSQNVPPFGLLTKAAL